jgi:MarR family transcriptional regulator, organic hydroperoxide resistance regulator
MHGPDTLDRLLVQVCRLHHGRAHTLLEALSLYRGQPPLLHIVAHEDGLSHSDIAARLHVTPATVSKMVSRMEKTGVLTTRSDPADQRVSRVYLTEEGYALMAMAERQMAQLEVEAFAGFTPGEREQMQGYLTRIRTNLLAAAGDCAWEIQDKECEGEVVVSG